MHFFKCSLDIWSVLTRGHCRHLQSTDTPFPGVTKANQKSWARFCQNQYKKHCTPDLIHACYSNWAERTEHIVKNQGGPINF